MSKNLPLWTQDESDVRPEYRLQYGHILIAGECLDQIIPRIEKALGLRRPLTISNSVCADCLPRHKQSGLILLSDQKSWHFIIIVDSGNTLVFAPHFLFFTNRHWAKLSSLIPNTLLVVTRGDIEEFHYHIFEGGNHVTNACHDTSGIRESIMAPLEVCLDGKTLYRSGHEKARLVARFLDLISVDAVVDVGANGVIQVKGILTNAKPREVVKLTHGVYESVGVSNMH